MKWVIFWNGAGRSHFLVDRQVLWVSWNIENNQDGCGRGMNSNNHILNSVTLRARGREPNPYYF